MKGKARETAVERLHRARINGHEENVDFFEPRSCGAGSGGAGAGAGRVGVFRHTALHSCHGWPTKLTSNY